MTMQSSQIDWPQALQHLDFIIVVIYC